MPDVGAMSGGRLCAKEEGGWFRVVMVVVVLEVEMGWMAEGAGAL